MKKNTINTSYNKSLVKSYGTESPYPKSISPTFSNHHLISKKSLIPRNTNFSGYGVLVKESKIDEEDQVFFTNI